jgi:hypothetical protein
MRAVSLVVLLAPNALAVTRSYLDVGCQGIIRTTFPSLVNTCMTGLFAKSVYSDEATQPNAVLSAFRPSSQDPGCGKEVCSIFYDTPGHCCSINQLKIRGVILFPFPHNSVEQEPLRDNEQVPCTAEKSIDMWKAGAFLGVDIGKGEYIDIPNTTNKPPTKQEILHSLLRGKLKEVEAEKLASAAYKALKKEQDDDDDNAVEDVGEL